ncbi:MAG: hypothetical protein HZY76_20945 [Anaerolineae bacterium]|nr:MAG: hypothetical protein HZY76_20945 [Anaerolineae bacterium]
MILPALLPVIGSRGLVLEAAGRDKVEGVLAIQSLLLRLLATLPPAKLRFTFLDPIGLGQNAAPFMHLADYDDALVTARAWTEPQHIEQRLADLTEHMENVIQKYLRNQYPSIEDYNVQAGEVAGSTVCWWFSISRPTSARPRLGGWSVSLRTGRAVAFTRSYWLIQSGSRRRASHLMAARPTVRRRN